MISETDESLEPGQSPPTVALGQQPVAIGNARIQRGETVGRIGRVSLAFKGKMDVD